jgi:hypothetical protein
MPNAAMDIWTQKIGPGMLPGWFMPKKYNPCSGLVSIATMSTAGRVISTVLSNLESACFDSVKFRKNQKLMKGIMQTNIILM